MTAASLFFITGCDDPDDVRANPVIMKIDGTLFRTKPDKSFVWGPGGTEENTPDAKVKQYGDYFVFSVKDFLYDSEGTGCELDMDFIGLGLPQLGVRYELAEPESELYGSFHTAIRYRDESYLITGGWMEFSEFGINNDKTKAYVSGTFGLSVEGGAIKITGGRFGRMLECSYSKIEEQ